MKRWVLGALGLLLLGYWGAFPATDAGELYIVETLMIESQGDQVQVWGETVSGTGETLQGALENLVDNTPGQLFLGQTKRVIFCTGAEETAVPDTVPMGAVVYRWEGTAQELVRDLADLEPVLDAREQRETACATLAGLENARLAQEIPSFAELRWERDT